MHILQITNHGLHQWEVVPGLPDTGGQNVFVNQFSQALADLGFEVTIANRGGYRDPVSGRWRRGIDRKDDKQRILYIEDGLQTFVRKEDMAERIPYLVDDLERRLQEEGTSIGLIISHYWDGAKLGVAFNETLTNPVPHVWVPHSLGAIKKGNLPPEQWAGLRIDERLEIEKQLVKEVDAVASTSSLITQKLQDFYGYTGPDIFLPPCVDLDRYHPRTVPVDHPVWALLSEHSKIPIRALQSRRIVTEISRTDITKRKDILIKAFSLARETIADGFLVVSIDQGRPDLAAALKALIRESGLEGEVAAVGSVWDMLPWIYAVSSVYCTPAIVEGFGMSAQEAAATGVPVIASHRVPFVTEYLLGDRVSTLDVDGAMAPIHVGEGAIVAQADDIAAFGFALHKLLSDPALARSMGRKALEATVPYFTWPRMTANFLDRLGISYNRDVPGERRK